MMRNIIFILIYLFSFTGQQVFGQDNAIVKRPNFSFRGYIKDLQMVVEDPINTGYLYANQIHNRLNFSYFPNEKLTFKIETRNRFFTGSLVTDIPGFKDFMDTDEGITDLTYATSVGNNSVLVLQIDRAWADFRGGKWDITVGRQRINWGLNNVWNPNDVFNAYNLFEFDYEERPGSDAVRIQYETGGFSFLEGVVSKGNEPDDLTYALMYRFNTHGYDIQVLAGNSQKQPLAGLGWAGNILDAGFKTEATWFGKGDSNTQQGIVISSGLDYTLKDGWYLNLSYLYNSTYKASLTGIISSVVTPDPFPYEHAVLFQFVKEINPVWNINASTIYSADNNVAVIPAVTWSFDSNWELLFYVQYFQTFNENAVKNTDLFLRLKWSFAK